MFYFMSLLAGCKTKIWLSDCSAVIRLYVMHVNALIGQNSISYMQKSWMLPVICTRSLLFISVIIRCTGSSVFACLNSLPDDSVWSEPIPIRCTWRSLNESSVQAGLYFCIESVLSLLSRMCECPASLWAFILVHLCICVTLQFNHKGANVWAGTWDLADESQLLLSALHDAWS